MRILRCAAWILLIGSAAMTPLMAAWGYDGGRTLGLWPEARFARFAPLYETALVRCGPAFAWRVETRRIGCEGRGQVPVLGTELRVFALYGPRDFSTFPGVFSTFRGVTVVPGRTGETTLHAEPLHRQADDPWLGFDKVQHLTFSFLWTLGTQYVAVNKGHLSESRALPISIGTSAVIGLSKEYYDLRRGPTNVFSYKDLLADGVGILLATGLILL